MTIFKAIIDETEAYLRSESTITVTPQKGQINLNPTTPEWSDINTQIPISVIVTNKNDELVDNLNMVCKIKKGENILANASSMTNDKGKASFNMSSNQKGHASIEISSNSNDENWNFNTVTSEILIGVLNCTLTLEYPTTVLYGSDFNVKATLIDEEGLPVPNATIYAHIYGLISGDESVGFPGTTNTEGKTSISIPLRQLINNMGNFDVGSKTLRFQSVERQGYNGNEQNGAIAVNKGNLAYYCYASKVNGVYQVTYGEGVLLYLKNQEGDPVVNTNISYKKTTSTSWITQKTNSAGAIRILNATAKQTCDVEIKPTSSSYSRYNLPAKVTWKFKIA